LIQKAYKVRIYPTKAQEILLSKTFGCVRFVWNQRVEAFNNFNKENPIKDKTVKEMKAEFPWLAEVPYNALEQKLMDWNSFKSQFFNKKRKKALGRPKFKSKGYKDSFRLSYNAFKVKQSKISLSKIGFLKTKGYDLKSIPNLEKCKQVTISRDPSGKMYMSILIQQEVEKKPMTSKVVGIDLGLTDLLTLSSGLKVGNPRWFRKSQAELARAQRRLSKKTKGSKRYHKQRIKVNKIHEKVRNQRNWFYHNLTTWLVNEYDVICLEDLNVSGMLKNKKLSKSISDAAWSSFLGMLSYKATWYGKEIKSVDRFYPSSQICSVCGHRDGKKELSVREWTCSECGTVHDRDLNASINILKECLGITSEEYSDYSRGDLISRPESVLHPKVAASMKRLF
jgi:putative transposase